MPPIVVEIQHAERTVHLLLDDKVTVQLVSVPLGIVEELPERVADHFPIAGLVQNQAPALLNNGLTHRGVNLVVFEQNQIRILWVTAGVDGVLLDQLVNAVHAQKILD